MIPLEMTNEQEYFFWSDVLLPGTICRFNNPLFFLGTIENDYDGDAPRMVPVTNRTSGNERRITFGESKIDGAIMISLLENPFAGEWRKYGHDYHEMDSLFIHPVLRRYRKTLKTMYSDPQWTPNKYRHMMMYVGRRLARDHEYPMENRKW